VEINNDTSGAPKPAANAMECRRCGVCCTLHQAFVRPDEIQRITAFLGITADDWERTYADTRWEYHDYSLIRHVNGACAFLTREGGRAACRVHAVKPACCSAWVPGPDRKECRLGMENGGPAVS
jgi:Fe-S-cluster containining protein